MEVRGKQSGYRFKFIGSSDIRSETFLALSSEVALDEHVMG